ncbi:hypothetical protein QP028_08915 [Corynebacterium suedekumii]|nr:hypothetical protein QP028_08915 [Corynebacterium suedekumii]
MAVLPLLLALRFRLLPAVPLPRHPVLQFHLPHRHPRHLALRFRPLRLHPRPLVPPSHLLRVAPLLRLRARQSRPLRRPQGTRRGGSAGSRCRSTADSASASGARFRHAAVAPGAAGTQFSGPACSGRCRSLPGPQDD